MNSKFRCRGCKSYFPQSEKVVINRGTYHSIDCATQYGREEANKLKVTKEKKSHSAAKRKLKDEDRSFQLKKTQQIFNSFIRLRDANDVCISCGRYHSGQYHAGHYRSVGGNSSILRFNPDNCHRQCAPCNNHLSGNLIPYRVRLISKIGLDRVEKIEGPHEPKRYTIDDLKEIQNIYKLKTKELESC